MLAQSYYDESTSTWRFRTLAGAAGSGLPIGAIVAIHGNAIPSGYLECNGQEFDIIKYPALYTLLNDNHTPDLRELSLVGIGQSERDFEAHDVYTLGQAKDDQIQRLNANIDLKDIEVEVHDPGHTHATTVTTEASSTIGNVSGTTSFLGGAGTTQTGPVPTVSVKVENARAITGITANLTAPEAEVTLSGYRYGAVTRGKRYGVRYIIKANTGSNELDDDKVYGDLVAFLEEAYTRTDKEDLQDHDLLMYDAANDKFIPVPRATINGKVLSVKIAEEKTNVYDYTKYKLSNASTSDYVDEDFSPAVGPDEDWVLTNQEKLADLYEAEGHLYSKLQDPDSADPDNPDFLYYEVTDVSCEIDTDNPVTDPELIEQLEAAIPLELYKEEYEETIVTPAVFTYEWKAAGGARVHYFATEEEFEAAKLIADGEDGYLDDGCIVVLEYKKNVLKGVDA